MEGGGYGVCHLFCVPVIFLLWDPNEVLRSCMYILNIKFSDTPYASRLVT